jgi:hypothetical protein
MMNVTRFCALCVPLSVRTLLLVCRGTSSGPMQSARALAAMTMTGASAAAWTPSSSIRRRESTRFNNGR